MIEIIVQIVMSAVLLCAAIGIGISLLRVHNDANKPDLLDLITSTDKSGRVRFDSRKCFEAGAFLTATWILVFITSAGKFNEAAFGLYMATYTAARFLRDREQRLAHPTPSTPAAQPAKGVKS